MRNLSRCHIFNLRYTNLDHHFNIVSRKNLQIQPCFITRRKTLSCRKFVKKKSLQLLELLTKLKSQSTDSSLFFIFDDVTRKQRIRFSGFPARLRKRKRNFCCLETTADSFVKYHKFTLSLRPREIVSSSEARTHRNLS